MTREDALNTWLPIIQMGVENMPECKEALDMAIKALEQEPKTGQKKNCNNCKYGYLSSTCEKPNAEICGNDFSQWVSYKAESER